jgi:hypothetical protein
MFAMPDPIVFISHFQMKDGELDAYRQLQGDVTRQLREEKPRTLAFLTYLNESGTRMTAIHVFADPEAMDIHFQGSQERSRRAYEFLAPEGWEIYGRPSASVIEAMEGAAASAGVPLSAQREYAGGVLRATAAG